MIWFENLVSAGSKQFGVLGLVFIVFFMIIGLSIFAALLERNFRYALSVRRIQNQIITYLKKEPCNVSIQRLFSHLFECEPYEYYLVPQHHEMFHIALNKLVDEGLITRIRDNVFYKGAL